MEGRKERAAKSLANYCISNRSNRLSVALTEWDYRSEQSPRKRKANPKKRKADKLQEDTKQIDEREGNGAEKSNGIHPADSAEATSPTNLPSSLPKPQKKKAKTKSNQTIKSDKSEGEKKAKSKATITKKKTNKGEGQRSPKPPPTKPKKEKKGEREGEDQIASKGKVQVDTKRKKDTTTLKKEADSNNNEKKNSKRKEKGEKEEKKQALKKPKKKKRKYDSDDDEDEDEFDEEEEDIVEYEEVDYGGMLLDPSCPSKPPPFKIASRNVYVDTEKPKIYKDDIPVCNCIYIEGISACESNCMNRIISTECHPRLCPCGEHCLNQQFQKRTYAKLKLFLTKNKGWGVCADEDIVEGQFIIEYVGEVISPDLCVSRLSQAMNEEGIQQHYYIITIDGGEFIDASVRGNLARYINHSCNPNCQTQKWFVRGAMRVGIFAMRDIKKGTELTFDYQFERMGQKKQKCYCGEANCWGYLGDKKKKLPAPSDAPSPLPLDDKKKKPPPPPPVFSLESHIMNEEMCREVVREVKSAKRDDRAISLSSLPSKPFAQKQKLFLVRNLHSPFLSYLSLISTSPANLLKSHISIPNNDHDMNNDNNNDNNDNNDNDNINIINSGDNNNNNDMVVNRIENKENNECANNTEIIDNGDQDIKIHNNDHEGSISMDENNKDRKQESENSNIIIEDTMKE